MEKINYIGKVKNLHKEIVASIIELMNEGNVSEVDLLGSDAPHAFVSGYYNGDVVEMEVSRLYLNDGKLELDVVLDIDDYADDNGDISDAYQVYRADDYSTIIPCCGMSDVYESVYQILRG